jgi:thiamine-phosphate pyrophosphorylase
MAVVASAADGRRAAPRAGLLRLRAPGVGGRELEAQARELVAACALPVIVSSRCDIALATGCAGVHLPEGDISVRDARTLLGDLLIGRSVHTLEGAVEAERDGADYVLFGPVWPSPTHPGGVPTGVAALAEVAHAVRIPVLAIGGVNADRIAEVTEAGAAGYASIGLFR